MTHDPYETRCMSLADEIACLQAESRSLSFQTAQQAQNAAILNAIAPNPIQTCQPGGGALALGLLGMALSGGISTNRTRQRMRYTGTCPHCGAPVDAETDKCAYCECYYD